MIKKCDNVAGGAHLAVEVLNLITCLKFYFSHSPLQPGVCLLIQFSRVVHLLTSYYTLHLTVLLLPIFYSVL